MKKTVFILISISLVAFSCCKSAKSAKNGRNMPLVGTQWNLTHIESEDIMNDFALRPFLIFDSTGAIRGNLGCNTFFGEYQLLRKNKVRIEYKGATKRLCQKMDVEKKFINALKSDITSYETDGNVLILFSDKKEVMRFTGVDLSEVE